MINYGGAFEPQKSTVVDVLPVGAYVGKVIDATVETVKTQNGQFDRLILKLDVAEGEHKDHYSKLYASQAGGAYPARYKGVIRFTIPQVGGQYENGQRKALEHLAWCLQESNPRYKWDGDESKMKGLAIGFSVREKDWMMESNGEVRSGTTTEIGRVECVSDVRDGKVRPMKKKELRDAEKEKLAAYAASQKAMAQAVEVYDEDLPF